MHDSFKLAMLGTVWLHACSANSSGESQCEGERCSTGDEAKGSMNPSPESEPKRPRADSESGRAKQPGAGDTVARDSIDDELTVRVRDADQLEIKVVTLACAGDCADIEAVASGGKPPYTFSWEDGSTDAKRRVCLHATTSLRVAVTDTAVGGEFWFDDQTTSADLTAIVANCAEGGVPPATDMKATTCTRAPGATCTLPGGKALPEDMTVKLFDEQQYFAGGADLPAGRYRLTYLDGCFAYGDPALQGWTVHFATLAGFGCWIIDSNGLPLMATPGTEGSSPRAGAHETYDACVAANCEQVPLDFEHAGGKLGLARNGGTALAEFDDSDASELGGRGPTFRLSRLDPCP